MRFGDLTHARPVCRRLRAARSRRRGGCSICCAQGMEDELSRLSRSSSAVAVAWIIR
jgi:hypothetical protein